MYRNIDFFYPLSKSKPTTCLCSESYDRKYELRRPSSNPTSLWSLTTPYIDTSSLLNQQDSIHEMILAREEMEILMKDTAPARYQCFGLIRSPGCLKTGRCIACIWERGKKSALDLSESFAYKGDMA